MTRPQDARLAAALEYQYTQLFALLARADRLRLLIPPPTATWRGSARRAYETGLQGVAASLDAAIGSLRSAHGNTGSAMVEVNSRV